MTQLNSSDPQWPSQAFHTSEWWNAINKRQLNDCPINSYISTMGRIPKRASNPKIHSTSYQLTNPSSNHQAKPLASFAEEVGKCPIQITGGKANRGMGAHLNQNGRMREGVIQRQEDVWCRNNGGVMTPSCNQQTIVLLDLKDQTKSIKFSMKSSKFHN